MPLLLFQTEYFRILLFFWIFFPHEGLSIKLRLKLEWKNFSHGWNYMTQNIYWFDSLLPVTSLILPLSCGFGTISQRSIPALPRAASSALPSPKSHCLDLHRRLCIPDRQRKAKKPEQECKRQPAQAVSFGAHSKMATAGDMYLLERNLFWIRKQLFLYSSKKCSIIALAVSLLPGQHHTEALSPEMTSRSNMSLRPSLKSSSMFSICVPALRRWELHHAVNV